MTDLILDIPGVKFGECYPDRIDDEVDGVVLSIRDLENLIKAKNVSGQLQDLADSENLEG